MDVLEELRPYLLVALGFFAGIFGPILIEWNKRAIDVKETYRALVLELRDLRYILASVAVSEQIQIGTFDRTVLQWAQRIMIDHDGMQGPTAKLVAGIGKLLAADDGANQETATTYAQIKREGGVGKSYRKYALPLLDHKLGLLGSFPSKVQNTLLQVKAQLSIYNEHVEDAQFFNRLTFQSLSEQNRKIVLVNLDNLSGLIGRRAKLIAEKVSELPELTLPSP